MKVNINRNVVETTKTIVITILVTAVVAFIGGFHVGTKNADAKYNVANHAAYNAVQLVKASK